jgi:putative inorganic carbon (HCO3(-)) transporter
VPIKGILLFAISIFSLPVCFFWPFYGILCWTVIAYLNPQSSLFYWSAALNFPWALAVAVPTLIGFLLFTRDWLRRLAEREVYLMVALWVWFTITTLISTHSGMFVHHAAMTWYRWGFVSKILLMTFSMIAIVNSFERLRILIVVTGGCFAYFVLKGFPFILITGGNFRIYGPDHSMIADNNDFGLAMNMTLPLFFLLAKTEPRRWTRWFWGLVFVLGIPVLLFTYSRGAMVGLVAVLALMLLQLRQRWILAPVLAVGVYLALTYAPESWKHRMDPTSPDVLDASAHERLNAWAFSRNLAADYPIAGGGFETFTSTLFSRYAPQGNDIHGPHSVYFQLLAEHGYVGLTLYMSLVLSCFVSLYQISKIARGIGDLVIAEYAKMFHFSFVGFLTSGVFLGRAYFDYFFSFAACVVILGMAVRERVQELEEAGANDEVTTEEGILASLGG